MESYVSVVVSKSDVVCSKSLVQVFTLFKYINYYYMPNVRHYVHSRCALYIECFVEIAP